MKKKMISLLVVFVMCVGLFAGCTGVDVTTIATINGEKILKGEYLFYCEQLGLNVTSVYLQYGYDINSLWDQPYSEEMTLGDYVKTASMEQLIEVNILAGKAEELGITLTEEEKAAARSNKKNLVTALGSADAYEDFRKTISLTDGEILEIFEKMELANKVQNTIMETDERFTSINEEVVGKYYEENYFKAKHILVMNTYQAPTSAVTEETATEAPVEPTMTPDEYKEDAKVRAQGLLEKALAGEDFDRLMAEFSEDPGSKTSPDGYVFTAGEMVPEFENAVKALEIDGITETLVESSYGWHIIKRLALTREDKDFTENYETYLETYEQMLWTELINEWRAEAQVAVDQKVQNKVNLSKLYWGVF